MRKIFIVAAFVALSACATMEAGPRLYPPQTVVFDPSTVAWASQPGSNAISGNAVMRTVGGDVRTCAGAEATLVPVSPYATERMVMIYKNSERGFAGANEVMQFAETDQRFVDANRRTVCDSQGNFQFDRLPDGEYYVVAVVTWGVVQGNAYYTYTSAQGGVVMQRVRLQGGETRRIVLTN